MSSSVSWHVLYKIANAPINPFPFPHIYVRDVFPQDFYRQLRAHLPPGGTFRVIPGAGHNPMWERPAVFNREVLEFLRMRD